jgi:tetratricopeptide (TPR) repeat protein
MKRSVIIFTLISFTLILGAQQPAWDNEECTARLTNAEVFYRTGDLINCIQTLENALKSCDFSRKDKEKALELLARSYVETGDYDKADETINKLLVKYPNYELKEAENPEMFNRLVKRYRIHPVFTLGVKNTANWLRHKTTGVYSVLSGLDYSQPLAESGYWFTYYGVAEYEFIDGLSINGDLMFFWSNISRDFSKDPGFELNYWEKNFYIELPFYLKKYFDIRKSFFAYASAGIGPFFTYKSIGNVTLKYTKNDAITGKNADFDGGLYDIDVLPLKNKVIPQWNAGFGVGYKIKNFRFVLDARYLSLLGSINNPENSDAVPKLKNDYFYIDQEMKINQFEVGATISYTLFNSVKRMHK